jgi:hypothetical protein
MKKILFGLILLSLLTNACKTADNTNSGSATAVTITIGGTNSSDPTLKPLLGVISGPGEPADSPAPDLTQRFQEMGITNVRNNDYYDDRLDIEGIFNCGGTTYPSWEGCDASKDQYYNWTKSDAEMDRIVSGGFKILLRLGGEWENENPKHDFKGPQNATQENNWIIAAKKVVARYQNWKGASPLTSLDIWTEFPGTHFWDRSNKEFTTFWIKAYKSIKAAYPDMKLGGPGFSALVSIQTAAGQSTVATEFLKQLYKEKIKPDWFGWHLFQTDPDSFAKAANGYTDLIAGTGAFTNVSWAGSGFFNGMEVYVDAYGNSDFETVNGTQTELSDTEKDAIYNGGKGAAFLTGAWIQMQYANIEQAYYYRGADGQSSPGGPGLFYGDATATPKPTAYAFRLWSTLVKDFPTLLTASTDSKLWVLAAENNQNQKAVLVANGSTEDMTYTITGTSLKGSGLYLVDDTNSGEDKINVDTDDLLIRANSVELVILP